MTFTHIDIHNYIKHQTTQIKWATLGHYPYSQHSSLLFLHWSLQITRSWKYRSALDVQRCFLCDADCENYLLDNNQFSSVISKPEVSVLPSTHFHLPSTSMSVRPIQTVVTPNIFFLQNPEQIKQLHIYSIDNGHMDTFPQNISHLTANIVYIVYTECYWNHIQTP